jgi:hypothetical protein
VKQKKHYRLVNPTTEQFYDSLREIQAWLQNFKKDPEWDGGGLQLSFAGHGRKNTGALVLKDGDIEASVFIDALRIISNDVSKPGRLRVSIILDSCYSGAFITEVLEECFYKKNSFVIPFHLIASCMIDEQSWEESSLGHGIFTYTFSVRPIHLFSIAAQAIQPDNTWGPSVSLASGVWGCSLITVGAQNPVLYWNGSGHIEIGNQLLNIFDNDNKPIRKDEIHSWLKIERDKIIQAVKPMQPQRNIDIS